MDSSFARGAKISAAIAKILHQKPPTSISHCEIFNEPRLIWVVSASDNEDRVRAYLPAFLIVVASVMMSSVEALAPANPKDLLAVFPPWWSSAHVFAAASPAGAVAAFGPLPFIVAIGARAPGLADRLKASGALFLFDASRFRFCAI